MNLKKVILLILVMEKRLSKKAETYNDELKEHMLDKVGNLKTTLDNDVQRESLDNLIKYINSIKPLQIVKEDLLKRKRTRNHVLLSDRCIACRANGEQCSRRKKDSNEYCGTHIKGTPHGIIKHDTTNNTLQKEVWGEDIGGIIQYIDKDNNIYKHEDIMNNVMNPNVVGKCELVDGKYIIKK